MLPFLNKYGPEAPLVVGYSQGFHTSFSSARSLTIRFRVVWRSGDDSGGPLCCRPSRAGDHHGFIFIVERSTRHETPRRTVCLS